MDGCYYCRLIPSTTANAYRSYGELACIMLVPVYWHSNEIVRNITWGADSIASILSNTTVHPYLILVPNHVRRLVPLRYPPRPPMFPVIPSGWTDAIAVHPRYAARGCGQKSPALLGPEEMRSERRQEMDRETERQTARKYDFPVSTVLLATQPVACVRGEAQRPRMTKVDTWMGIGYGIWRTVNIGPCSDQSLAACRYFYQQAFSRHSLSFPFPSLTLSIIYYNAPIRF